MSPFCEFPPDGRRGRFQDECVKAEHARAGRDLEAMARPADHDEVYGVDHIRCTVPGEDFSEGVRSDDEVELVFSREAAVEALDCIDGVAFSAARFNVGGLEGGLAFAG